MIDSNLMPLDRGVDGASPAPDSADAPGALDGSRTAPLAEVAERDGVLGAPVAGVTATAVSPGTDAARPEAAADDARPAPPDADSPAGEAGGAAMDETAVTALAESVATTPDGSGAGTPAAEAGVTVAALVETLVETAAPRRNKRRHRDDVPATSDPAPESVPADATREDGVAAESALPQDHVAAPAADELDDATWREQWPTNAVHIVGRLLPRVSDAPVLDGVQRTRMDLALVEQLGDAFGTLGNVPLFVLPGAPGFTPIYNDIQRARKQKRRLEPIMVEVHGVLRQMPDRDLRYASERYAVLMGVEVHQIRRVARDAEQFAYWRGCAQVVASRRYEHKGIPYQRVTAVVALKQRKPRLRGTSVTHIPVDFLVAPDHEHADRFRHIGQHLLIEATIGAAVYHLHADHPALAGIEDPRRKAHLQVLRESVVTVTLGEFPDEAAERDYRAWVTAGRPGPQRHGRGERGATAQGPAPEPSSDLGRVRTHGQGRMPEGNAQADDGNGRRRRGAQADVGTANGEPMQADRHGPGRKETGT